MKKLVAVFIAFYFIAMGTMFVWGYIDKQNKENQTSQVDSSSNETRFTSQNNTAQDKATKKIMLSDVQKHNSPNDCWIIVSDMVYDVTNYLKLHPGGEDLIAAQCGKNATTAFSSQGGRGTSHSSKAKNELSKYLIGFMGN